VQLHDRVALVTGGGSGIGRAIALRFAREGARVVVNDVRKDAAQRVVEEVAAAGGQGAAIAADVADSGQVRAMFEEVDRALGQLDVLVNNAGIGSVTSAERLRLRETLDTRIMETLSEEGIRTHLDVTENLSDEAWHRMIGVHLNGTFFCTREALRLMSRRNRGAIVNISSVAALTGLESVPHYSAAKGGILAFTRAVAREVASRHIRVNAICPGFIDTPMTEPMSALVRRAVVARTPLGRWG
jgi:3-oxoacyl-[acyl-carrier protein] reductase